VIFDPNWSFFDVFLSSQGHRQPVMVRVFALSSASKTPVKLFIFKAIHVGTPIN